MRKKVQGTVSVRAISGTHVVFLAMSMDEQAARGLMGFAIQRVDLTEDETVWLRGNKTFAPIRPPTGFKDFRPAFDPLGAQPVTLTGSANWSLASADTNDENLVVIRGDKRVADIYFGEFMRVFAHHRFRESVKRHIDEHGTAAFNTWKPQDLFEDWRKWVPQHFRPGSEHDIKRRYFADV
jgi:hypothetical protein